MTYLLEFDIHFPLVIGLVPYLPHLLSVVLVALPFLGDVVSQFVIWQILQESISVFLVSEEILLDNDEFLKVFLEELVGSPETWMKWVIKFELSGIFITNVDAEVLSDGGTHLIRHISSFWITDPAMHTSSTGEDPKAIFEFKVFLEHIGEEFSRQIQEVPALLADVCSRAT